MTLEDFLARRAGDKRMARLTHDIPLPEANGLEFGAAANPTPLPERVAVAYVDHAVEATPQAGSVRVDHVWSGSGPFPGTDQAFDFAIAAQVAQYVPNLLGWFRGVHGALRPGGVFNLSLPDRRFMFDVRRAPSTVGRILDAFYGQFERSSPGQVFDHTFDAVAVDPSTLWGAGGTVAALPRYCGEHALQLAAEAAARAHGGASIPCHCWVFTPLRFLSLIEDLSRMRLFPFVISQFASTDPGDCEFFACLRRDREEDAERLLAMQLDAIAHVRGIAQRQHRLAAALARD